MCHAIMKWNPDVVVTEKGVSGMINCYFYYKIDLA